MAAVQTQSARTELLDLLSTDACKQDDVPQETLREIKALLNAGAEIGKGEGNLVDRAASASPIIFANVYGHFQLELKSLWPPEKYVQVIMQNPRTAKPIFESIKYGQLTADEQRAFFRSLTDQLIRGRVKEGKEYDFSNIIKRDDDRDYQALVDEYMDFYQDTLSDKKLLDILIPKGIRQNARYLTRCLAKRAVESGRESESDDSSVSRLLRWWARVSNTLGLPLLTTDNVLTLMAVVIATTDNDSQRGLAEHLSHCYLRLIAAER